MDTPWTSMDAPWTLHGSSMDFHGGISHGLQYLQRSDRACKRLIGQGVVTRKSDLVVTAHAES